MFFLKGFEGMINASTPGVMNPARSAFGSFTFRSFIMICRLFRDIAGRRPFFFVLLVGLFSAAAGVAHADTFRGVTIEGASLVVKVEPPPGQDASIPHALRLVSSSGEAVEEVILPPLGAAQRG
ncbi:MAG: hypothetical protein AAFY88_24635, partial [Acidobacteriota bacterium]